MSSSHSMPTENSSRELRSQGQQSPTAYHRVKAITERNRQSQKQESAVATALANRAYHLPGYGYCADLCQYLVNNHLLFGLCCRHPEHPIGNKLRAINLLGSALFGLAMTNLVWLAKVYWDQDPNDVVFQISFQDHQDDVFGNSTNTTTTTSLLELIVPGPQDEATAETLESTLQITKGMVFLWTVGGCLHAAYDSLVWYAAACACCLPGNRCESWAFLRQAGGYCIYFLVVLVAALASFAVVVRVTVEDEEQDDESSSSYLLQQVGLGKLEFLVSYFVEFLLALFIYYPLFQLVLFSGMLGCVGCNKIRFLGGRPFEMKQSQQQQQE